MRKSLAIVALIMLATGARAFDATPLMSFFQPPTPTGLTPPITTGLILWLDASDASTITTSGGRVTQWNDKSGWGNHATAETTNAPIVGTFHGRTVMQCGGTNFMVLTTPIAGGTSTIFAVVYKNAVANGGMYFWGADATPYANMADQNTTGQGYSSQGSSAAFSPSTNWANIITVTLRVKTGTTANHAYYANKASGTVVNNTPSGTTWKRLFHYGGAGYSMNGGMAALYYYSYPLSDADVATMQDWLIANYGE